LNKNSISKNKQTIPSPFISTPNKIISSPLNHFDCIKTQNQPFSAENKSPSILSMKSNAENKTINLNFGFADPEDNNKVKDSIGIISVENQNNLNFNTNKFSTCSSNKIIPNKWDEMEISGKNFEKYKENKADMLTGLDECEDETLKNDMDFNLDFKISNFFNDCDKSNSNGNKFGEKNIEISKIENKLFNKDNYFDRPTIEIDEESLVTQLDKIDFAENADMKIFGSKSSGSNSIPNYFRTPEGKIYDRYKFNINNNEKNENAIIKQVFGNENLNRNYNYSTMSIQPNSSMEDYNNDYVIKNETDLDLIFDMIYKSQKISLDVMYNLRNKLRIRGYNTVLSLRLKKDKDKSWNFLYEDYKDISPEIEALALIIEYYLEKKLTSNL